MYSLIPHLHAGAMVTVCYASTGMQQQLLQVVTTSCFFFYVQVIFPLCSVTVFCRIILHLISKSTLEGLNGENRSIWNHFIISKEVEAKQKQRNFACNWPIANCMPYIHKRVCSTLIIITSTIPESMPMWLTCTACFWWYFQVRTENTAYFSFWPVFCLS